MSPILAFALLSLVTAALTFWRAYKAYKPRCDARRAAALSEIKDVVREMETVVGMLSSARTGVGDLRQRAAFNVQQMEACLKAGPALVQTREPALMLEVQQVAACAAAQGDEVDSLYTQSVSKLLRMREVAASQVQRLQPLTARELLLFVLGRERPRPTNRRVYSATVSAERVFGWLELVVPRRIADEQLGDALEVVHQLVRAGRPRSHVRAKVAATAFWVLVHTIGAVVSGVTGRKGA
ncbi:MAG: hypothetical protein IPO09_02355 [Anaeromyxobacter sp.]|nr:hypothetical protein [Anaeromyxobacter sp.]